MSELKIASPFGKDSEGIAALAPMGRAVLRCRAADIERISERLGVSLPVAVCGSEAGHGVSALWLGPDEWLLLLADPQEGSIARLTERLAQQPCSIVDVSHRQVALSIHGPRAEDMLSAGCALDLRLGAFPVGMCTRTLFGKAEVILWRTGLSAIHLEVWRSFARYVEARLREAESEP